MDILIILHAKQSLNKKPLFSIPGAKGVGRHNNAIHSPNRIKLDSHTIKTFSDARPEENNLSGERQGTNSLSITPNSEVTK